MAEGEGKGVYACQIIYGHLIEGFLLHISCDYGWLCDAVEAGRGKRDGEEGGEEGEEEGWGRGKGRARGRESGHS